MPARRGLNLAAFMPICADSPHFAASGRAVITVRIERLTLRRFKSVYEQEIPFGDFNVITGPNGSGKSNLFSALAFIGELHLYGLDYAVGRAGGIDAIAYRRTRRTTVPVEIEIVASFDREDLLRVRPTVRERAGSDLNNVAVEIRHKVSFRPSRSAEESTFEAGPETLSVSTRISGDLRRLLEFTTTGFGNDRQTESQIAAELRDWERDLVVGPRYRTLDQGDLFWSDPSAGLLENLAPAPFLRLMQSSLARLKVFRISAQACREPGLLTPSAVLGANGGNLPGVIARMRRSQGRLARTNWSALMQAMQEVFTDLDDIRTEVNSAGQLETLFLERGVGRAWRPFEISDGTIEYLALMCLFFDERNPALVVEEPENGLHSWMLRSFLDRVRTDSRRQVLLTTHSPTVLRSSLPGEVLVTWRSDKVTRVAPLTRLDPDSERVYSERGVDVFEQYDSGFLTQSLPTGLRP